jgi:hypothetical protein
MNFKIERLSRDEVLGIYDESTCALIQRFGNFPPVARYIMPTACVADRERNVLFLRLENGPTPDDECNYLLIFDSELVVIHVPRKLRPLMKFQYISPVMLPRLDEIKVAILEAFECGGYYLVGMFDEVIDAVYPKFDDNAALTSGL